jgi:hypothetical protein
MLAEICRQVLMDAELFETANRQFFTRISFSSRMVRVLLLWRREWNGWIHDAMCSHSGPQILRISIPLTISGVWWKSHWNISGCVVWGNWPRPWMKYVIGLNQSWVSAGNWSNHGCQPTSWPFPKTDNSRRESCDSWFAPESREQIRCNRQISGELVPELAEESVQISAESLIACGERETQAEKCEGTSAPGTHWGRRRHQFVEPIWVKEISSFWNWGKWICG